LLPLLLALLHIHMVAARKFANPDLLLLAAAALAGAATASCGWCSLQTNCGILW
jgi:hypothetical protein